MSKERKSVTLLMEVLRPDIRPDFYNPAVSDFRAYPRTVKGVKNALRKLEAAAQKLNGVLDYRVKLYEGRKEYYNDAPLISTLTPSEIRMMYAE